MLFNLQKSIADSSFSFDFIPITTNEFGSFDGFGNFRPASKAA